MMMRYDTERDDMVAVDQDWCDSVQHSVNMLAMQREILRTVSSMNAVVNEDDLKKIWNFIRSLGFAETVAGSLAELRRQREISKRISDGLNAGMGLTR